MRDALPFIVTALGFLTVSFTQMQRIRSLEKRIEGLENSRAITLKILEVQDKSISSVRERVLDMVKSKE